jgi:hypothetical protein
VLDKCTARLTPFFSDHRSRGYRAQLHSLKTRSPRLQTDTHVGQSKQILSLGARLHDAHLLGRETARGLERFVRRTRQPRLEIRRIRDKTKAYVDAETVKMGDRVL